MVFDAQEWNCRAMGHPSCNFEKRPDCFPRQRHHSTFPPTVCEDSNFATSPPTLVVFWFWFLLTVAVLVGVRLCLTVVLTHVSL